MSKKSPLWSHFTAIDEDSKVECLYCYRKLSVANKSTCSLIRHMNKKHPSKYSSIVKQEGHKSKNKIATFVQQIETHIPAAVELDYDPLSPDPPRARKIKTAKVTKKEVANESKNSLNNKKQKEIDRQLVTMITKEYHPFSIVEDMEFVKFINLLNPGYKVPTRKVVSHSLIPAIYDETVETVKNRLRRASVVCLTADGWTSRTLDKFYAITAHYIVQTDDGMALEGDSLGCITYTDRHDSDNIANKLKDIVTEWQLDDKAIVIVSDNETSIKAAARSQEWHHWPCFAKSLNTIAQAGLEEIQPVIEKIKIIVSYFEQSPYAAANLAAMQEDMNVAPIKLKKDDPTRWNSTFDMINRVLSVKTAVLTTIAILRSSTEIRNDELEEIDLLTPNEWLIIEQAVKVLEVFDALTTVITSENKVTISSIIIYLKQLKTHLRRLETSRSNLMPEINNMVTRLLFELDSQFFSESNHIEDNELIGLSTILDPRFKKFAFIDDKKYKKMLERLYSEVARIEPPETSDDSRMVIEVLPNQDMIFCSNLQGPGSKMENMLFKDFDNVVQEQLRPGDARASAIIEVDKYLEEPLLPRKDANGFNADPLLWWFQRKHVYPRLMQLVKARLCIMATSAPCQKIFTRAGQMVSEKRRNFKANKISKVVFLNHNLIDAL